jgi:PIN domain nuclease of toxin-antitoxin system
MQQIDHYIKEKRLELSASIRNRKIVYLDTNYWIKLREQNKQNAPSDRQFLTKLTELVELKKCVCPISEVSFWEILKQQDAQTLKDTTQLVDKFSDGISIINEDERIQLEFIHFIRSNTGHETYDLKELVWTKLAFISCANMLSLIEPISAQKSFFDFLCNVSLFEMVSLFEKNGGIKPVTFKDDIEALNRNKLKYAEENKSFKQMFLTELGGYLDLYQESINKAMCHLYYMDSGHAPSEEEKKSININLYKNAIYNGFKYEKITH